jgi:translocation and assembly module TamB
VGPFRGTDTNLEIQGAVPVNSTTPMSLLLLGNADLRLAQVLNPDITSSGQLRFNINSFGTHADPNVQGQVLIIDANFAGAVACSH